MGHAQKWERHSGLGVVAKQDRTVAKRLFKSPLPRLCGGEGQGEGGEMKASPTLPDGFQRLVDPLASSWVG